MTKFPFEAVTFSACETAAVAEDFARVLKAGDVVAFRGGLGAGKTVFAAAIAAALGCKEIVRSPTYTIICEYPVDPPLGTFYHIDAYRLRDAADFIDIGGPDYFENGGLCAVEWSERIAAVIPARAYTVDIEVSEDGSRKIRIYGCL